MPGSTSNGMYPLLAPPGSEPRRVELAEDDPQPEKVTWLDCTVGQPVGVSGPARNLLRAGRTALGLGSAPPGVRACRAGQWRSDRVRAKTRDAALEDVMSDELIEVTERETLSREAAAARLHRLADQLARHNEIEFVRDGTRYSVTVPDEVTLKVEIELGDENEIEFELTW
jgi:amphi-Trp domain-containing protein